jgi:lysozyme
MSRIKKKNKPLLWTIVLFFLLTGLPTAYYYINKKSKFTGDFVSQFPDGFSKKGIDISHHQGDIDWPMIFDKLRYDTIVQFVYCKATQSTWHVDTKWKRNRKMLTQLGILHGAYHFFDGKSPPKDQVKHFLQHWDHRDMDLAPMLDVETEGFSDSDLIAKMKIWLEEVEKLTGHRPIIYCSLNYFETKFKRHFKDYHFWIAAYSQVPESLNDKRVLYWQFSEKGQLPGCDEWVDLNVGK